MISEIEHDILLKAQLRMEYHDYNQSNDIIIAIKRLSNIKNGDIIDDDIESAYYILISIVKMIANLESHCSLNNALKSQSEDRKWD